MDPVERNETTNQITPYSFKVRKRRCNSNDDAELQPFFRKHVFWQTQIALLQAFCQVQVSLWGFAAQSSKYFWNRFIVRLCSRTAALYASRGIASRHDCLGPRLPLFFPIRITRSRS